MTRPILFLILIPVLAGAAGACVSIDGGAVEASWVVRTKDGRAINDCGCADPRVARVRFTLVGDAPEAIKDTRPCDGRKSCEFSCQRGTGVTPFDIPEGRYAISLTPVDGSGQDLTRPAGGGKVVEVPAAIVRDVVTGQPTELSAILIVANCAVDCSGANENHVCKSQ